MSLLSDVFTSKSVFGLSNMCEDYQEMKLACRADGRDNKETKLKKNVGPLA
jgi:hypothetical protein